MDLLTSSCIFRGLTRVSLTECVISGDQCDLLPLHHLHHLHLATVFVLQSSARPDLSYTARSHKLADALSGLSELSMRIVLKRERYEGYFDSQPDLYLELFRRIDQDPSRLTALDLDSQVLKDIPSDLFSSSLARIENINLTEANLTSSQVTSLVSPTIF